MNRLFCALAMTLAASAPLAAKHWHDERGHGGRCYIRTQDVEIVREYYEPRYRSLPPGLAKKYARTGQLPPGWARRIEPVPVIVERRLEPIPPRYRRGVVDGYVVVYEPRTQVVIDVAAIFR
jgi:hypothetical protein